LELNVPLGSNNYFLSPCGIVAGLASATGFEPCTTIGPFITFDEGRNDSSVGDQPLDERHLSNQIKINSNETRNSRYLLPELCWVYYQQKIVKIIFQKFLSEVNHSGQKIKIRIEKLWVVSYFST
jgi:hypothetical protein